VEELRLHRIVSDDTRRKQKLLPGLRTLAQKDGQDVVVIAAVQ
jgi:hypothetical protein